MATVGYAWVGSIGQNLDVQFDKLREYGCEEIFQEKRSGRTAARPALKECLLYIRRGDVLVIIGVMPLCTQALSSSLCGATAAIASGCKRRVTG